MSSTPYRDYGETLDEIDAAARRYGYRREADPMRPSYKRARGRHKAPWLKWADRAGAAAIARRRAQEIVQALAIVRARRRLKAARALRIAEARAAFIAQRTLSGHPPNASPGEL